MGPILVRENNVEKALKILKRFMQKEGRYKELRARRAYMKPSEERKQKAAESMRRRSKVLKRRYAKEGY